MMMWLAIIIIADSSEESKLLENRGVVHELRLFPRLWWLSISNRPPLV